jgi:hypothetical protein
VRGIATAPTDLYVKELIGRRAKGLAWPEDHARLILAGSARQGRQGDKLGLEVCHQAIYLGLTGGGIGHDWAAVGLRAGWAKVTEELARGGRT